MLSNHRSSRTLFRSTFLIYVALTLGQVVFSLFIIFLITQPDRDLKEGSDYPFLGLLVVFLAAGAAWFVNKLRKDQLPKLRFNHDGKLLHYRTSVIMRSAMVEAGNLFCLILALLEGSLTPMLYFCVGMVIFLYFRPQLAELVQLYGMNEEERQRLEQQLKNRM
ncbi:hypothetical protein [Lewinella cohaerens]|uniref:hypothetical protein n=1 Tax=Lewinella cohaerens TaxID=70995 RepID=UPI00036DFFD7|nr:hypothetical protein [Lewinella cohaerens]